MTMTQTEAPAASPNGTADHAETASPPADDGALATTLIAETHAVTETSLTITSDPTVPSQVRHLMEQINRTPALTLSPKAQEELARIVKLLPDLVSKNDPYLADAAALAVTGLMEGEPSLVFARSVRREIEGALSRWKMPFRAMYRGRPPMRATLGLLLFLGGGSIALSVLAWVGSVGWSPHIQGIDGGLLGVVAAMGGLGSIISIFVRVPHMSEDFRAADPEAPFFVGLLKPMVGIAFAAFTFVAIEGGFMPITIDPGRRPAFYMAISFVAGFSERFVPDIINKAEGRGEKADGGTGQLLQQVQALALRLDAPERPHQPVG